MLSKDPANRWNTPAEVAAALSAWSAGDRLAVRSEARRFASVRQLFSTPRRAVAVAAIALAALSITTIRGSALITDDDNQTAEEPADPPEPHLLYREGLRLLSQRKERQVHMAIARLEKAVALAPDFALAQTALADAYNLCGASGWDFADAAFPKAKAAARLAIEQEPKLAEAHLAEAFALHAYDCDFKGAEAEFLAAIKLNSRLPAAHHWYAWFLAERGRADEAADEIKRARKLAPDDLTIRNDIGRLHYLSQDFKRAAEDQLYVVELDPDYRKVHRDLGLAYAELGKLDEAMHGA